MKILIWKIHKLGVNPSCILHSSIVNMLVLARVITIGAYNRNESRGAHYKPEFPDRNDDEWLKQH